VQPHTHKLKGNNYYFSSLPGRFKLWQDLRVKGTVTPLPTISPAWLAAYRWVQALCQQSATAASILPLSGCKELQDCMVRYYNTRMQLSVD
jgi:hypothetical protein